MSTVSPFVDFRAGEVILHAGDAAGALYIIDTGDVTVTAAGAPGRVLAELGPGDFFGEMAILQEQAHSADVTAKSAVRASNNHSGPAIPNDARGGFIKP